MFSETIFLTGFPGFLGSNLLKLLVEQKPLPTSFVCLVQNQYFDLARRRVGELANGETGSRIRLLAGDITLPDLGLEGRDKIKREITEIFHLAAVYDLSVGEELAMRVNVHGTKHVLGFAAECPRLRRVHYVSTCYVSGRHEGVFTEKDLAKDQEFNNHYEETKFLAEMLVQDRMKDGMPVTIYRPAIVVGDSHSGATQKYDGPYFIIQWILRQPRIALMPVIGHLERVRINVVPQDFVIEAMVYLSGIDRSLNNVYHLCDPEPPTAHEMLKLIGRATARRVVRVPLPERVAREALEHGPGVYRLLKIPPALLSYFTLPTKYSCENTLADLAGSGISCPPFASYVDRLIGFMREHPKISAEAMV